MSIGVNHKKEDNILKAYTNREKYLILEIVGVQ